MKPSLPLPSAGRHSGVPLQAAAPQPSPAPLTACGGCASASGTLSGSGSGWRCGCCGSSCSPSSACREKQNCSALTHHGGAREELPELHFYSSLLLAAEFYLPVVRALGGLLPLFWLFFNGFGIHRHWRFLLCFYFSWGS